MALQDTLDLFGRCHSFLFYDLAPFDHIDRDRGINKSHRVEIERVRITFHFEDILAAQLVAACVLNDRDLVVFFVKVKVMIDQLI